MLCPLCGGALHPVERQGIEIDHCGDCGGIWMDQGELSELVRREALAAFQKGQDALTEARHDREYDKPALPESNFHIARASAIRKVEVI
jgi:Zn-finger nucleic acid-binding protein